MKKPRHKVPLKLKFLIAKDTNLFRAFDNLLSKLKPPRKYRGKLKKILFIRNDRVGDAIVTIPVLRDLKLNYPELEIHVLVSNRNKFVFEEFDFIDKLIVFEPEYWNLDEVKGIFKLTFIGNILQIFYIYLFPYIFNKTFRNEIKKIKQQNYDAAVDLSGGKLNLMLSRAVSKFTVGSKLFGVFWLYTYYIDTNWVSHRDFDFMTRKIEECIKDAFGFEFIRKDASPIFKNEIIKSKKEKGILVHIGTSELRKLEFKKEEELIDSLADYNLIITDAGATERFNFYKQKYSGSNNIEFKLYEHLEDIRADALKCKLLLCYDGGQALYLSQFTRTVVIFGPGTATLWKPYEFEDYEGFKNWENGVKAIQSKGKSRHTAIYYPIWCSPCFDIGCKTRPCLNNIKISYINEVIGELIGEK